MEPYGETDRQISNLLHTKAKQFCVGFIGIGFAVLSAAWFSAEDVILYAVSDLFQPTLIFVWNAVVALCLTVISVMIIRPKWRPESYRQALLTVAYGTVNCLMQINISLAIFIIGPGNAVALLFTMPVMSVFLSVLILGSRLRMSDIFFAVCSCGGVAMISLSLEEEVHQSDLQRVLPSFTGVIFATVSSVSFASTLIIGSMLNSYETAHPLINLLSYSVQYSIVACVLCASFNHWALPTTVESLLLLTGTGLTTIAGIGSGYLAVGWKDPTTVSIILSLEVPMTYVGQLTFFNFAFSWLALSGSVLILISAVGSLLYEDQETHAEQEAIPGEHGEQEIEENLPMLKQGN